MGVGVGHHQERNPPPPDLALSWPLSGGGKAKVIPRREHGVGGGDMSPRCLRGSVHLQLGCEAQGGLARLREGGVELAPKEGACE